MATVTKALSPRSKRRWFKFSLRSLMILTTVAAVIFGLMGADLRKYWSEQQAIDQLASPMQVYRTDYASLFM